MPEEPSPFCPGTPPFSEGGLSRFIETQLGDESVGERARESFHKHAAADGNWMTAESDEDAAAGCAFDAASRAPAILTREIPAAYFGEMFAALAAGRAVFCFNPRWGEQELREARAAVNAACTDVNASAPWHGRPAQSGTGVPPVFRAADAGMPTTIAPLEPKTCGVEARAPIGGTAMPLPVSAADTPVHPAADAIHRSVSIYIATGGTGGGIRFVRHTLETLSAAARAQNAFLQNAISQTANSPSAAAVPAAAAPVHCHSPLPPWHVSGLMPFFRAFVSGGTLRLCDPSFSTENPLPPAPSAARADGIHVLSVVPTQLHRILEHPDGGAWLRRFDCVLAGGAALPSELAGRARRERVPLGIGYGMTETAAFIALQTPAEFLAAAVGEPGAPPAGRVLPHARVQILDAVAAPLPDGHAGRVAIAASSLAPDTGIDGNAAAAAPAASNAASAPRWFLTQDEGVLENGRLRVLGRLDRFINTGGEKIDPRRVEAAILECPFAAAALVVGEPCAEWGARVTALVELWGGHAACEWQSALAGFVRRRLAPPCVPKRWVQVPRLPFDEKGKLDRALLARYLA